MQPITFCAEVYKVQTLVDCGVRVTLDLPETAIMQMAELAECKRAGVVLEFTATVLKNRDDQDNGTIRKGTKWQSKRQAEEG